MCHQAGNSAHISVTELHTGGHSACKLPVRQIWTSEGSQRVVPPKEVPFGGLNDVPLNFGGKTLQNFGGVNRTFKPEQQKLQTFIT